VRCRQLDIILVVWDQRRNHDADHQFPTFVPRLLYEEVVNMLKTHGKGRRWKGKQPTLLPSGIDLNLLVCGP
jgi:hypothetical protein